jgi:quinolinate synthase
MFGADVVRTLEADYPEAYVTAHLEVPGEMFQLALQAKNRGRGVVGSTADILRFVHDRVREATEGGGTQRLQFVLGTEAGMVTAIVRDIRDALPPGVEVEIVFPVAAEAIASTDDGILPVVPGVAGGEGCSVSGGCATCPYMKMNSFDAMVRVLQGVGREDLSPYEPEKYTETIAGHTVAELGGRPILHMRDFQRGGVLGEALVEEIDAHHPEG